MFTLRQTITCMISPSLSLSPSPSFKCSGSCNQVEPATPSTATHSFTGARSYRHLTSRDWPARYHGNKQSSVQSYRYWSPPCRLEFYSLDFFFLLPRLCALLLVFFFLTLTPQQQQCIWYWEPVSGRTHRHTKVFFFRLLRKSCQEILTVLPFHCNRNQGHLDCGWRTKLSELYIRYLQQKEKTRHRSLHIPPGLCSHPSACSQFPQSCLRRCRECMRLSSVAHFTRWSDWIRCNSLYFHSHSPLGESKVPERFHAWDRGVAVARFPLVTDDPRQHASSSTSERRHRSVPMAPSNSVKKRNLPAKQKKLNCGSDDHSGHSTRAQLWSSSKEALRLASNKKERKKERIYSRRADIVRRKVRWNSVSLL